MYGFNYGMIGGGQLGGFRGEPINPFLDNTGFAEEVDLDEILSNGGLLGGEYNPMDELRKRFRDWRKRKNQEIGLRKLMAQLTGRRYPVGLQLPYGMPQQYGIQQNPFLRPSTTMRM